MDDLDERLLRRSFNLAKLAKNQGHGAFGALLAEGKSVLFEAENTVGGKDGDPTRHAEMNLLRLAGKDYDSSDFARFTMYCSTEPCAMCAAAAFYYGVGRIVYGMGAAEYAARKGRGLSLGCREVFKSSLDKDKTVEVVGPLLAGEAERVHD